MDEPKLCEWIHEYPVPAGGVTLNKAFGIVLAILMTIAAMGAVSNTPTGLIVCLTFVLLICIVVLTWVLSRFVVKPIDRITYQICPVCHHKGRAGYVICPGCGHFPSRKVPPCVC